MGLQLVSSSPHTAARQQKTKGTATGCVFASRGGATTNGNATLSLRRSDSEGEDDNEMNMKVDKNEDTDDSDVEYYDSADR